mmetsp:Transcript_42243/g.109564  ORF Transcript_42243/g.109564 Transcript_42243/m.109564 type:complete len:204 (+) Transcript_42243:897-1508(+)
MASDREYASSASWYCPLRFKLIARLLRLVATTRCCSPSEFWRISSDMRYSGMASSSFDSALSTHALWSSEAASPSVPFALALSSSIVLPVCFSMTSTATCSKLAFPSLCSFSAVSAPIATTNLRPEPRCRPEPSDEPERSAVSLRPSSSSASCAASRSPSASSRMTSDTSRWVSCGLRLCCPPTRMGSGTVSAPACRAVSGPS